MLVGMSDARRPGWVHDPELPTAVSDLHGPLAGEVHLPLRVYWTGPEPEAVSWDLSRESRRARLYEIVLREGALDDVLALINGPELVRLWDRLWLPAYLRQAWQPLIDAAYAV
jgi:hypothetical protein